MAKRRGRIVGGREAGLWVLGLCCGLGAATVDDLLRLPAGAVPLLAVAAPLVLFLLGHLLPSRRRVVVWEERWGAPAARPCGEDERRAASA